jgi:hypothetical protein
MHWAIGLRSKAKSEPVFGFELPAGRDYPVRSGCGRSQIRNGLRICGSLMDEKRAWK